MLVCCKLCSQQACGSCSEELPAHPDSPILTALQTWPGAPCPTPAVSTCQEAPIEAAKQLACNCVWTPPNCYLLPTVIKCMSRDTMVAQTPAACAPSQQLQPHSTCHGRPCQRRPVPAGVLAARRGRGPASPQPAGTPQPTGQGWAPPQRSNASLQQASAQPQLTMGDVCSSEMLCRGPRAAPLQQRTLPCKALQAGSRTSMMQGISLPCDGMAYTGAHGAAAWQQDAALGCPGQNRPLCRYDRAHGADMQSQWRHQRHREMS